MPASPWSNANKAAPFPSKWLRYGTSRNLLTWPRDHVTLSLQHPWRPRFLPAHTHPRPIPPPSSEFLQHGILSSKVFLPVLWWPNCISLNHCFDSPLLTDKIGHSKMIYSQIFFFCGVLFRDDVHSYFAWPNPKVFIAGFVCFFSSFALDSMSLFL